MDSRSMMSGGGSWVLLAVLFVLLLVAMAAVGYLAVRGRLASARRSGPAAHGQHRLLSDHAADSEACPLRILRTRYACGETELEDYERRLVALLREQASS